jgi:hypothetical protein
VYCVGQEEGGVVAKVESVIITDNIFENQSTTVGNSNIWLSFVNNVIVKGNISRGSYRCLYLTYGSNVDITDNHIMDALYEGIWITEPDAGYQNLGYTKTIRINNNRIENTGRTAVLFQYCDGFSISGNTIRNSSYETDGTRDAINLSSGAKNGQVFNNRIRYGTGFKNNYGIQATASCTSIQTFNNDVEGKNGRLLNASVSGFEGYYIHSADGTRYKVTIANGGTISITAG